MAILDVAAGSYALTLSNKTLFYYCTDTLFGPVQVAASLDDGYESADGSTTFNTSNNFVYIYSRPSTESQRTLGFLRFDNVTIPQGATINSVMLDVYGINNSTYYTAIDLEDIDDAPNLASPNDDIVNRTLTGNPVDWDHAHISQNDWLRVTSPTAALQAVVDRAGWASGNAIAFVIAGQFDGTVNGFIAAYDIATSLAATLAVDYTEATATTIDVDAGSYSLTGSDVTLTCAPVLDAGAGSYTVTGSSVTLTRAIALDAATDSYALTGAAATLYYDLVVRPIAHINVVQRQRMTGEVTIGVVAVAKAGIASVDWSISDGTTTQTPTSTAWTYNSRTASWEYATTIDLADFDDGNVTIDATVTDGDSNTRECGQVTIRNNEHGTLTSYEKYVSPTGSDSGAGTSGDPYATIGKAIAVLYGLGGSNNDGNTVYLLAGTHAIDNGSQWSTYNCANEYLTIRPAPGLTKADVTLTNGTAPVVCNRIHLYDLTCTTTGTVFWNSGTGSLVDWWFDNCSMTGTDRTLSRWIQNGPAYGAYTDSTISEMGYGTPYADFVRGCTISDIGQDAFVTCPFVLNCDVDAIDPLETTWHADLWQYYVSTTWDNVLMMNVRGTNLRYQGIMSNAADDDYAVANIAFVNTLVHMKSPLSFDPGPPQAGGAGMLWERSVKHLLLWHVTFTYTNADSENKGHQAIYHGPANTDVVDSDFRGSKFTLTYSQNLPSVTFADTSFDYCHVDAASSNQWENLLTNDKSTGDAGLGTDWRPEAGSALLGRLTRLVPFDADNNVRSTTTAVGAYRGPSEGAVILVPEAGSYTLAGSDVSFEYLAAASIDAEAGSYAWTGNDVTLAKTSIGVAGAGDYQLTGTDASLLRSAVLMAEAAAYVITGADAILRCSAGGRILGNVRVESSLSANLRVDATLHGVIL